MDKKGNSAADRDQLPSITLFGKRMKLTGTASEPPPGPARHSRARRGSEDAEGRRVFWVAVGVFALVLLAALLGPRLLHPKDGTRVGPPVDGPVDGLGKTQAPRRPARDEAYIRRLRERMQQYEREKAQDKYQESPQ